MRKLAFYVAIMASNNLCGTLHLGKKEAFKILGESCKERSRIILLKLDNNQVLMERDDNRFSNLRDTLDVSAIYITQCHNGNRVSLRNAAR
ncbi:hypothetical protein TNCV_3814801 [Trichonephila clavipes]|nr:hypothetical protein TNCV_3814801 [Trichonephila clavipes]